MKNTNKPKSQKVIPINKTKGIAGSKKGNTSERRCVGCRQMVDKRELVRIVRNTDGDFSIDETKKAAGRGAYLCKNADCVAAAIKNRGLDRSFKGKVPSYIYDGIAGKI
ncbi:MAG: YlxR family protein [Defluviitaleaceae bacterium]|nr:YlxR family protein [Defluviitaleaceae bacterium]